MFLPSMNVCVGDDFEKNAKKDTAEEFITQMDVKVSLRDCDLESALRKYVIHLIRRLTIVGNITRKDSEFYEYNLSGTIEVLDLSGAYFTNNIMPINSFSGKELREIHFPKANYLKSPPYFGTSTKLEKIYNLQAETICCEFRNTAIKEAAVYAGKIYNDKTRKSFPDGAVITNMHPSASPKILDYNLPSVTHKK